MTDLNKLVADLATHAFVDHIMGKDKALCGRALDAINELRAELDRSNNSALATVKMVAKERDVALDGLSAMKQPPVAAEPVAWMDRDHFHDLTADPEGVPDGIETTLFSRDLGACAPLYTSQPLQSVDIAAPIGSRNVQISAPNVQSVDAGDDITLNSLDAAFEQEIQRVSHVSYDSHEICKHFYNELRKRLSTTGAKE